MYNGGEEAPGRVVLPSIHEPNDSERPAATEGANTVGESTQLPDISGNGGDVEARILAAAQRRMEEEEEEQRLAAQKREDFSFEDGLPHISKRGIHMPGGIVRFSSPRAKKALLMTGIHSEQLQPRSRASFALGAKVSRHARHGRRA
jgi:hypothetical protein